MTTATSTEIKLDFSKLDGLLPGIVQDAATGAVLMVGFLNEESYQKTLASGTASTHFTFWRLCLE